jgi:hypothetical protein
MTTPVMIAAFVPVAIPIAATMADDAVSVVVGASVSKTGRAIAPEPGAITGAGSIPKSTA